MWKHATTRVCIHATKHVWRHAQKRKRCDHSNTCLMCEARTRIVTYGQNTRQRFGQFWWLYNFSGYVWCLETSLQETHSFQFSVRSAASREARPFFFSLFVSVCQHLHNNFWTSHRLLRNSAHSKVTGHRTFPDSYLQLLQHLLTQISHLEVPLRLFFMKSRKCVHVCNVTQCWRWQSSGIFLSVVS
jgi:hypothetical protein